MYLNHNMIRRLVLSGLLLMLITGFSLSSPYFFTQDNLFAILREASTIGIIALGMTFVIIAAGIDLSVGSIVAFVAMACVNLIEYTTLPVPIILVLAIGIGGLIGLGNGWIIVKFKMPDFIVTLASMGILRGLTLLISIKEGAFVKNVVLESGAYTDLSGKIGPVYWVTLVFFAFAVLLHVILRKTRLGVYTYAVGADLRSAQLSGIHTNKIKMLTYLISGITCAVVAIFLSARMMTATPDMGTGMDLDVIAAVVIGGTAFSGGKGDMIGTVIGAIFMAVVQNGIYKFHISSSYQPIIMGSIIIISIILDEWYKKHAKNRLSRLNAAEA